MVKQTRAKQERIIEAVRRGLEGDSATEFVHRCGYAMTLSGIARHLRSMGGRGKTLERIKEGKSNIEILRECFPDEDLSYLPSEEPAQGDLFPSEQFGAGVPHDPGRMPAFETTKFTIKMPTDLYEAVSLAAKAEGKKRNQLIVEILTHALSRTPEPPQEEA